MKAYVLHNVNDLHYENIEIPDCPQGWAVVKVKAAGICSSDIARVFTKGTYHFPTIPGHEFSGKVCSVGDEKDAGWIGKKVGVFPLIPCRECSQCEEKHYEMCTNYDYVGSRRDGGFAEYVIVPVWNLIALPDIISYTSAAMLEPLSVALHAVKQCDVKNGSEVAVIGTGMIGIAAAQWTYKYGAKSVVVIGRSEAKRTLIEKCGLTYSVAIPEESCGQYDIVIEAVGSPAAVEMAITTAKPGGMVLLMGNPSGDMLLTQEVYWKILRKQLTIRGTWNSSYDGGNPSDWTEVIKALQERKIDVEQLISHTYVQEDMGKALDIMRNHKEPYCKIMTLWNQ